MIVWDTSALVRCYSPLENGYERAKNFLLSGEDHAASEFITLEVASAVVRKLGRDRRNREALLGDVEKHLGYFDLMVVSAGHMELAGRMVRRHSLRAADALHLATGLLVARDLGRRRLSFLTADALQAAAARAEHLKVIEL